MNHRFMSALRRRSSRERGFTLVELMVTVAIALFLLGGLLTILQNVRSTYNNQQSLAVLQDEQRFAMTVLTDVIQSGGYYPSPQNANVWQPGTALPGVATTLPATPAFLNGQAFTGAVVAGKPDTLGVRYRTALNDGVILCDGSSNIAQGPDHAYANQFWVALPAAGVPGQLWCQVDNNAAVPLVNGVVNMQIFYGVKRDFTANDYNVDTYLSADQMNALGANGGDWANISSVKVRLTFTNPLAGQTANQPQTLVFERVVEVMGRAGLHT
ncbi:MAG TPA: PilW family protein [Steroidobacteraceae bacterium]